MFLGKGSASAPLSSDDVRQLLTQTFDPLPLRHRRVLVIIPDATRTAPIPLMYRLLYEQIGRTVKRLDYLVALGTHPAVADGGEVIIYAPHLHEVSYTHGALIERVGYHVRDYFLKQPDRFRDIPGAIKAHSTHLKGAGTFDAATSMESPRIRVTLATGISQERCERINLGYADYREFIPEEWRDREAEGILLVPHAGEVLYRAA